MVARPKIPLSSGRDVIRAPGHIDASSGSIAFARSLENVGSVFMGVARLTGKQVAKQSALRQAKRGQELGRAAGASETTTLADGTVVPTAALSDETTIFSEAYNKAVLDTADNRFSISLRENLSSIAREHVGNPAGFASAARKFYDGLRDGIPEPSQAKFDNKFSQLLTVEVEAQSAKQVAAIADGHRGSNLRAIEEIQASVDRVGRDLTSPNDAAGAAATLTVLESRDDLVAMLDQTGPTGLPLYTESDKERILIDFDRRTERAGVLGAFDRAVDKQDFIDRWVESQKNSRVKSLLDLDQVESIAADMRAQLRLEESRNGAALKGARGEAKDVLSVLQSGSDAQGFQDVRDRLRALGDVESVEALDNAKADLAFMRQFAQQTPATQQGNIDLLAEKAGAAGLTLREQLRFDAMRRQRAIQAKALVDDPLGYAAAVGVIDEVAPLGDFSEEQIQARDRQVDLVSSHFETDAGFLRDAEVAALSDAVDAATPEQVVGIFAGFSSLDFERQLQLAAEIAPKRPELAAAISLSRDMPLVSREIVLGGSLARDNPDVKPGRTERIDAINSVVGNTFTPETALALDGFVEAANALYAARRVPGGDLTYDEDVYEQALSDVMGRPVQFNGRNILPPKPGMSEDQTEDFIGGLSEADLLDFGNGAPVFGDGTPFTVDMFDRGLFNSDAELVTSGFGRYMIRLEGLGFLLADGGEAYEIDLRRKLDEAP